MPLRNDAGHPKNLFDVDYERAVPAPGDELHLVSGDKGQGPLLWVTTEPYLLCSNAGCRGRFSLSDNPSMQEGEQCKRTYQSTPRKNKGKYGNLSITLRCNGTLGRPGRPVEIIDPCGYEFRLALAFSRGETNHLPPKEKIKAKAYFNRWFSEDGANQRRKNIGYPPVG